MTYTAIDGDVSDFIDSRIDQTAEFRSDELRSYLLNEGHSLDRVVNAIVSWQLDRFEPVDPDWSRFRLTPEGRAAVEKLRDNLA